MESTIEPNIQKNSAFLYPVVPTIEAVRKRNKEIDKYNGIYAINLEIKDDLEKLASFQTETGLDNFRVDAILSKENGMQEGETLPDKLKSASKVYIVRGGWCSDKEILLQLANDILKVDKDGVVLMQDHAGMGGSGFKDSKNIEISDQMTSLKFLNEATKKGMQFLGLGEEKLLDQGKKVVKIYHSRSAAAGLLEVSPNENVKQIFLAPVFGHEGLKPTLSKIVLPLVTRLGGLIYNKIPSLSVSLADPVRDLLIATYSGKKHNEILPLYEHVFRHTDKKVLAKFFYSLAQVKLEKFDETTFDPKRHKVVVYSDDAFVDPVGIQSELNRVMGVKSFNECVVTEKGDHHAFLDDAAANKNVINFVIS